MGHVQNQFSADCDLDKTEASALEQYYLCPFLFHFASLSCGRACEDSYDQIEFSWVRVCGILWDMCSGALPPERCCCEPVSRPRAVYQHQPSCPPCGADIQARRTTLDQSFSVAMENLTFFFTKPVFAPFIRNDYN